jgi:hypothetical protein
MNYTIIELDDNGNGHAVVELDDGSTVGVHLTGAPIDNLPALEVYMGEKLDMVEKAIPIEIERMRPKVLTPEVIGRIGQRVVVQKLVLVEKPVEQPVVP